MELWKDHEAQWEQKVFYPVGVLWMVEGDEEFESGSLPMFEDAFVILPELHRRGEGARERSRAAMEAEVFSSRRRAVDGRRRRGIRARLAADVERRRNSL